MEFGSRTFEDSHIPAIVALMNLALGERSGRARDAAYWRWKHLDNPFGRSIIRLAFDGETLIAFRAFMRWQFVQDGRVVEAVRAVDTATHPDYQRRGLFSRLTREALEDCRQAGIDFVFNTPNQNSYPGYIKLGWTDIGLLRMALRPARPFRWLASLASIGARKGDWHWPSKADPENDIPQLSAADWQPCHAAAGALLTRRSADYLRWRYLENPIADYRLEFAGNGPEALLLIARGKARAGARELLIAECLAMDPAAPHRRSMATALHALAGASDADYLIRHQPTSDQRWPGFFAVPGKGMHLTHKAVNDPRPRGVGDFALSLGDIEIF